MRADSRSHCATMIALNCQRHSSEPPMLTTPIDLHKWIEGNRDLLKPPVGNKCIVDGDFIVMIVGGPNARSDYHWDEGPEFFYQVEGEMVLKVQDEGRARAIPIRAGELFYLPPRMPHGRWTSFRSVISHRTSAGRSPPTR